MTTLQSRALPPPTNWQDFERLCFDLFARFWKTSDASFNGRTGQPQAGVDVWGTDRTEEKLTGVQCKGKDGDFNGKLQETELRAEVEKAKTFKPALDVFVLVTTAPDDVHIQEVARQISAANQASGLFEVRVQGWGTLKQILTDYVDVVEKHFPDFAPVNIRAQIADSEGRLRDDLAGVVERQDATLRLMQDFLAKSTEAGDTDDPLKKQIDLVAGLVADGEAETSLRLLLKLELEVQDTASQRNRYRLRANIGSALLNLGREAEAIAAFKAAYAFDPEWPNAIAISATAALLEGNPSEAYQLASKAIARDSSSAQAAAVIIDSAPKEITSTDLERGFSNEVLERVDTQVGLSLRATKMDDDAAARRHAEKAYEISPTDWRSLSAVAETILRPILSQPEIAISHHVEKTSLADFDRAIDLMIAAWEALKTRREVRRAPHVAINLINALDVAGRNSEISAILDDALSAAPAYGPLLRRASQDAIGRDDWEAVRRTISLVPEDEATDMDRLLIVQADIHLGEPERAVSVAREIEATVSDDRLKAMAGAMQIEASVRFGAGPSTASRLMKDYPSSVLIRSVAVTFLEEQEPVRKVALAEIGELITDISDPRDIFHAAEALYASNEFSLAADLYARIAATDKDTLILRRWLIALHKADRRGDARKLFEILPPHLQETRRFAEFGAAIYSNSGLLANAKASLEAALKLTPDDLELRLDWLNLAERLGRSDEIVAWLRTVPPNMVGRPDQLIQIALAMDRWGITSALMPIAYRALRAGYNDPDVHTAYTIGLFITGRAGHKTLSIPTTSGPDVAITLQEVDGERTLTYILETDEDPRIEREELAVDSPLATELSGLCLDSVVELSGIGPSPSFFKVTALSSKYLHAHFRSLNAFDRLFPTNKTLAKFTVDPEAGRDGLEPIFATARQRAERGAKIEEFYRKGSVPLALFAKLAGVSAFDIWDAVSGSSHLILMTCVGTNEELSEGQTRLRNCSGAVVDPVTLFGLVRMGIADVVLDGFTEVGLVQGSLDLLRALVAERREAAASKNGSLHQIGDEFAIIETPEEVATRRIADAEEALALAERLTLYPAEPTRPLAEEGATFFESLPAAYADTIFAAQAPGRVLLCDDRALRLLAEQAGQVVGVWSQAVVARRAEAAEITIADVSRAVLSFIKASSTFTMVPTQVVRYVFDTASWDLTDDAGTLIHHTTDPGSDQASLYGLWAEVLVAGWYLAPRAALKLMVAALLNGFKQRQPNLATDVVIGELMQRILDKLLMRAPLFKEALLDTTSLTSLQELRKPARAAVTKIADQIHQFLVSAESIAAQA